MACRILVIGDPHFKAAELSMSKRMADEIIRIAALTLPDIIVCLGDTLDRHETIHTEALKLAVEWIHELSTIAPFYLLIGNHDRPNNSDFLSDKHPFTSLKWCDNIVVVDRVITHTRGKDNFFFVPYVPPGRLIEALETNKDWSSDKKWTAGFSHQEIYGTRMGNIISENGDKWPLSWPLLINGHIHDRNIPQPNVISIGTPRQHAFDESPDKALSLFTFTQDGMTEERIKLKLPSKITYHLNYHQYINFKLPVDDNHTKIIITGNAAEIAGAMKLPKTTTLRRKGVKVSSKICVEIKEKSTLISTKTFHQRLQSILAQEDYHVRDAYNSIFKTPSRLHDVN